MKIANALADNGEAELLAIVQNTAPIECAGAISVLNHYYGRDDVPIGAYNVDTPGATLEMELPLECEAHLQSLHSSITHFFRGQHCTNVTFYSLFGVKIFGLQMYQQSSMDLTRQLRTLHRCLMRS